MKKSLKIVPFLVVLAAVGCERSGHAPKVAAADDQSKAPPTVTNLNPKTPASPLPSVDSPIAHNPVVRIAVDDLAKDATTGSAGTIECETDEQTPFGKVSLVISPNQGTVQREDDQKKMVKLEVVRVNSRELNDGQDFMLYALPLPIVDPNTGETTGTDLTFSSDPSRSAKSLLKSEIRVQFARDGSVVNAKSDEALPNLLRLEGSSVLEELHLKCESKLTNPPINETSAS